MAPSAYAESASEHGLDVITWTLERTGPGLEGWYWQTLTESVGELDKTTVDGYKFALLHVLAQDVGVLGVFSDWPATTTFYANCMGLGLRDNSGEGDVSLSDDSSSVSGRSLSAAGRLLNLALKFVGV